MYHHFNEAQQGNQEEQVEEKDLPSLRKRRIGDHIPRFNVTSRRVDEIWTEILSGIIFRAESADAQLLPFSDDEPPKFAKQADKPLPKHQQDAQDGS